MNADVAARTVAQMASIWPHATIADHTVEAWADATPDIEPHIAAAAMRRLAQTDDRPPSIARFMAEARLIVREQSQPSIATGPIPHSTRKQAAGRIVALKAAWGVATAGRPDHNHKNGDENCPRCSTSDAFLAEHAAEIAQVLRENPVGDR